MDADDLKHEVLFNVERYSALLNTPNLAELNITNLNTLIFNELTRLLPIVIQEDFTPWALQNMDRETYAEYLEFKKNAKPGDVFPYSGFKKLV